MSIPATTRIKDCIGKYARLDREIENGAGQVLPKGSVVRIVGCGRSLHIKTDRCYHCGQQTYIRDINKNSMTLLTEEDMQEVKENRIKNASTGLWLDEHYDHVNGVWKATCSSCKREAAELYGKVTALHKFCENCGTKMTFDK